MPSKKKETNNKRSDDGSADRQDKDITTHVLSDARQNGDNGNADRKDKDITTQVLSDARQNGPG